MANDDQSQPEPWWWQQKARVSISRNLERGSGYAVMARGDEQIVAEHRPSPNHTGSPCEACGKAWPCDMFMAVLAPE